VCANLSVHSIFRVLQIHTCTRVENCLCVCVCVCVSVCVGGALILGQHESSGVKSEGVTLENIVSAGCAESLNSINFMRACALTHSLSVSVSVSLSLSLCIGVCPLPPSLSVSVSVSLSLSLSHTLSLSLYLSLCLSVSLSLCLSV